MKKQGFLIASLILICSVVVSAVCFPAVSFSAEKYPSKPITILVTKSIGGSVDAAIRLIQPFLQKELGVPIAVQNLTSGGGRVAAGDVYKAEPDGYTLLAAPLPSAIIGQLQYNDKSDFHKFTPIFNVMQTFQTITVNYDSKVNSMKDLIALSKTKRVTLAGSGGAGSNASVVYAKLKQIGMKNLVMVPFPGASETAAAVMGNICDISSQSTDGVLTFVQNKTLKVLAVCSSERINFLPQVPTLRELGYKDFVVPLTSSVFGPPQMSNDKVKILEDAYQKVLANEQLQSMRAKMNVAIYPLMSKELSKLVKDSFKLIQETMPLIKEADQSQGTK